MPRAGGAGQRPVRQAGSLGPGAARAPLEHRVLHRLVRADHRPGREGDGEVARDDARVRQACLLACLAELAAAGVHLVERGPADGQPCRDQPPELRNCQIRLGRHHQVLRDPGCPAPVRVLRPPVRHVHVEVRPGLPGRGDIGGEHGGHAVLHLAGDPGVLRRDARGRVAVLELCGLIDRDAGADQVIRVTRQPRRGQPRELAAQRLPVPPVRAQQRLHPVRSLVPGLLGDGPAVRLHPRRQRRHVPERDLHAAALRQHPPQHRPDLCIYPRAALADIPYAGPRGRDLVVFFHKAGSVSRPPRVTGIDSSASQVPSLTVTPPARMPPTQRSRPGTNRKTGTVIQSSRYPARSIPLISRRNRLS
jgi:hypothetical protein